MLPQGRSSLLFAPCDSACMSAHTELTLLAVTGTPTEVTQLPADAPNRSSERSSAARAAAAQPDITASRVGPAGAVFLTPHLPAGSDVQSRIAAANASIQAFQGQLNASSAQASCKRWRRLPSGQQAFADTALQACFSTQGLPRRAAFPPSQI